MNIRRGLKYALIATGVLSLIFGVGALKTVAPDMLPVLLFVVVIVCSFIVGALE